MNMLNDKNMATDLLNGIAENQVCMANTINQCSSKQLRDTLISMRNSAETFQYDFYQMLTKKGLANPLPQASQKEIQDVKSQLQSC